IVAENKRNWEQTQAKEGNAPLKTTRKKRNRTATLPSLRRTNLFDKKVAFGLPSWFTSLQIPRAPINNKEIDSQLEYIFKNKLLKAENPKFPGCFFIGNIINTLRKVFPETRIDEIQVHM